MTHVDPAGRSLSLYSRSLFFSRSPLLLLLSYFLLCLGRTAADYDAVENHGGVDCDAMIFAAAQTFFWPICFGCLFVLTRFTCGNRGESSTCPVFNLRVPG